jgi:hypothetical protein
MVKDVECYENLNKNDLRLFVVFSLADILLLHKK